MSNIAVLFDIYRAEEISKEARIRLLKHVGGAINYSFGSNVTEEIVLELVLLLDPDNEIKEDEHYKEFLPKDKSGGLE